MLFDFVVGFIIAAGVFALLHRAKAKLLSAIAVGDNMRISTVIELRGPAPELENTVRSLRFLRDSGKLSGEICIRDMGADGETAAVAAALARMGHVRMIE